MRRPRFAQMRWFWEVTSLCSATYVRWQHGNARRSNWSISHSCRRAPSCKPAEGACGGLMRQTDRRAERRSPDCCVDSAAHAVCGQCYRIKDASPFANSLLTHVPFAFHIRLVTCSSQILFEVLKIPRCAKNVTLRFFIFSERSRYWQRRPS